MTIEHTCHPSATRGSPGKAAEKKKKGKTKESSVKHLNSKCTNTQSMGSFLCKRRRGEEGEGKSKKGGDNGQPGGTQPRPVSGFKGHNLDRARKKTNLKRGKSRKQEETGKQTAKEGPFIETSGISKGGAKEVPMRNACLNRDRTGEGGDEEDCKTRYRMNES